MAPRRTMALVAAVLAALAAAAVGKAAPAHPAEPTEGVLPGRLLTAWGEDLAAIQERIMSTPGVAAKIFNGESHEILRRNETSLWLTMRDGVRLWTVVSVPEGATQVATVLERTPYFTIIGSPAARKWNERGFAYVIQDQRGSGRSRGEDDYKFWRYCGQDGYDTMEWITAQYVCTAPGGQAAALALAGGANVRAARRGAVDRPSDLQALVERPGVCGGRERHGQRRLCVGPVRAAVAHRHCPDHRHRLWPRHRTRLPFATPVGGGGHSAHLCATAFVRASRTAPPDLPARRLPPRARDQLAHRPRLPLRD